MVARMALAEELDIVGEVEPTNQIKGSQHIITTDLYPQNKESVAMVSVAGCSFPYLSRFPSLRVVNVTEVLTRIDL